MREESHLDADAYVFCGFWRRVLASLVDNIIVGVLAIPIGLIMGLTIANAEVAQNMASVLGWILGIAFVLVLWHLYAATPGKMIFGAKILDEKTYRRPTMGKFIIRYIGYIPSALALCIGFLWVAFDRKKRGWHDLMAGTVVVMPKPGRQTRGRVTGSDAGREEKSD
ncbi:MAG: RDD family protein [Planctomycetes bacterium]|nr:RDD family protein [Planctomycetota bacterium]